MKTFYVLHESTFGHATKDYCRHGHHDSGAEAETCAASAKDGEVVESCRCGSPLPCALGHGEVRS